MSYALLLSVCPIVVAICEIMLSVFWVSWYFKYGFLIFRVSIPVKTLNVKLPPIDILTRSCGDSVMGLPRSICFHSFSDGSIAFRPSFKGFHAFMFEFFIMRGLIRFNRVTHNISVSGFVSWWLILGAVSFLFFTIHPILIPGQITSPPVWSIIGFCVGLYVYYYICAMRYRTIANYIAVAYQ